MQFESGIEFLDRLPAWDGKTKFDDAANRRLLARLGNPQDRVKSVHVAGTNGKGTVCAQLAAMLRAAGHSVGHYLSPHLRDVEERCLVNGRPITHQELSAGAALVEQACQAESILPTFFEAMTAIAFLEFSRRKLDWQVIEVGLGGRLDATNAIKHPVMTAITGIALDHMQVLGNTLADIAREKAGIIKLGVPVFVGAVPPEAHTEIERVAKAEGAPIEFFDENWFFDPAAQALRSADGDFAFEREIIKGRAAHDLRNTLLAVRVALSLKLPGTAIAAGLRRYRWPGRLEFADYHSPAGATTAVLFDVAHNPQGIEALTAFLFDFCYDRKKEIVFVVSILSHKSWEEMVQQLKQFALKLHDFAGVEVKWVFTRSQHTAAVAPADLRRVCGSGEIEDEPEAAFLRACEIASANSALVVVTGSIFLVGAVRPLVKAEPLQTIVD